MISLALDSPELADQYDVVGQRQLAHGKLLISDLGIERGHRVLDIGCGTGLLGAHVAEIVGPEGKVFGIDPLPLRVELAKKKGGPSFEPSVGRAEELSGFASESFDVVYLNSVVHWLPGPLGVLREIYRVLKPGGRVGFTTAARERPHTIFKALERALEASGVSDRAGSSVGSPTRLGADDAGQLFRATGFRETQIVIRTITDRFTDVDGVLAFSRASSFGNHLAGLSGEVQARVREALARELEQYRTEEDLELQRHLIFAVGEKERLDCSCDAREAQARGPVLLRANAAAVKRPGSFYDVITTRRSIRKYKPDLVEEEKLARVLEAARIAPSAGNRQPWHYIVVTDAAIRRGLQRAYDREWFYAAPVIICACGVPSRSWTRKDGRDYRDVDVAISFDHLVLAATAEGLGTCWIGAFEPAVVKELLQIPDGIEPIVLTPLGYPDESPEARERRSLADLVHRDTWRSS